MKIKIGRQESLRAAAYYLRYEIFVIEQQISPIDEFDTYDKLLDTQFVVIFFENLPDAAGRFQLENSSTAKPDRICVKKKYQNSGLGTLLLDTLEKLGRDKGCRFAALSGEIVAQDFYLKRGYQVTSEEFLEDGIPCLRFEKNLY